MDKIIKNAIQCKHCGPVAESRSWHDLCYCTCGKVFADGGNEYLRRGFQTTPEDDFIELAEWAE